MKLPFDFDAWMQKRWFRYTSYTVFFCFCFFLFAYWLFPYDQLRDYIVRYVEYPPGPAGRHSSGWEVDIASVRPSWGTGITASGVHVAKRPQGPGDVPIEQSIDEVTLHVSPWALLAGNEDVSLDANVAGGEIDADYSKSDTDMSIQAQIDSVKLQRMQILRNYLYGMPLSGTANGSLDLTVSQDIKQTEGQLDLQVRGLTVGDGKAKAEVPGMPGGLTIEPIKAGNLTAKIQAKEGVARITELHAKGKDAALDASGTFRLLQPLNMSRLDLLVRVKFADAYRNQSDRTRTLFSLMEFNPRMRQARAADGALQWRLSGSLGGQIISTPAGKAHILGK